MTNDDSATSRHDSDPRRDPRAGAGSAHPAFDGLIWPTPPAAGGAGHRWPPSGSVYTPPPPPGGTTVSRRRWGRVLAGAVAVAVLSVGAGTAGGLTAHAIGGRDAAAKATATVASTGSAADATTTLAQLVARISAQVVSISVASPTDTGAGSGIVVSSTGAILTVNHLVTSAAGGGAIKVTFHDGRTANATVLATDAANDLALIKATGVSGLSVAMLGNSDDTEVGDTVVAIGNELGLSGSVSTGIVSGLHRTLTVGSTDGPFGARSAAGTTYTDAIQTDAAINQGDSGGALFNSTGQVIGVNAAIATGGSGSGSSGSIGVGFAIPINTAKQFLTEHLA